MEEFIIYSIVGLICGVIMYIYIRKLKNETKDVTEKIEKAKEEGAYEPVSLYPYIDEDNLLDQMAKLVKIKNKTVTLTWLDQYEATDNAEALAHDLKEKLKSISIPL